MKNSRILLIIPSLISYKINRNILNLILYYIINNFIDNKNIKKIIK